MKRFNFLLAFSIFALTSLPALAIVDMKLSSGLSSSLHKEQQDREQSSDFGLALNAKINERNSFNMIYEASQDLKGERKFTLGDAVWIHSLRLNKELRSTNYTLSDFITIPLSEDSQKNTELYTRIGAGPGVSTDLSKYIRGLVLSYSISGSILFHKYETAATKGTSNSHYTLGNKFIIAYSLTERLSLGLDNRYSRSYTYQGNTKDNFIFDQSISYSASKNVGLSIGHNNKGNALAINGADSNVDIYNERTSTVYFTAELSF
jgi:hypothetical protein